MEYLPRLLAGAGAVLLVAGGLMVLSHRAGYTTTRRVDGVPVYVPARGVPLPYSIVAITIGLLSYLAGW